jgi:hypothetical protein
MFKFNLYDKLCDKVTGFTGTVMSRTQYATGCHHYGLLPPLDKDGKILDNTWIDESRLDLVEASNFVLPSHTTSGPFENPPAY